MAKEADDEEHIDSLLYAEGEEDFEYNEDESEETQLLEVDDDNNDTFGGDVPVGI